MKFIISVVDGRPERVVARRSERSGLIDIGRPVYYITIHMAAGSHVRTSRKGSENYTGGKIYDSSLHILCTRLDIF